MDADAPHTPVLYQEVLAGLAIVPGGFYIDGTVGAGGHASGILKASVPDGRLLGLDADPTALQISRQRLASYGDRVTLVHSRFALMQEQVEARGLGMADGVLLDLGVSSMQLAYPERGFSFSQDGPLDMRMDPTAERTAADLVNSLPERELADLIYQFGEEPASRGVARAIVAARPIRTTSELAAIVSRVVRAKRIHPATRTFQALRIAVNGELEQLEQGLCAGLAVLKPGGRLAVISFHSLEDRIVKRFFVREQKDCICPPEALICTCGHQATVRIVTKKPVVPGQEEKGRNPPSRSAKLRIAVKVGGG